MRWHPFRHPRVRTGEDGKHKERDADMAKQMTIDERKRIDFLLQLRRTPVQIAREMGRSKVTIIREIINRSVACDRGYRCSNRICALFDRCTRIKGYGRDAKRSFNCTLRCFEVCPDFVERTQEDINLVASYTRSVLNNRTPYDSFVERFGDP